MLLQVTFELITHHFFDNFILDNSIKNPLQHLFTYNIESLIIVQKRIPKHDNYFSSHITLRISPFHSLYLDPIGASPSIF